MSLLHTFSDPLLPHRPATASLRCRAASLYKRAILADSERARKISIQMFAESKSYSALEEEEGAPGGTRWVLPRIVVPRSSVPRSSIRK